jgi:glycosyltransferase involved in cell wall biosynthesis
MQKIKIVTIITQLELGGAQQVALDTVKNLDINKYEKYFITGVSGILDSDAKNIKNLHFYQVSNLQRLINPIKDFFALIEIIFILRKIKPDILHTHSSKAGILGRIAGFLTRVPIIIHTYHGFGFNDFQNAIIKNMYIFIERICGYFTDKMIFVSPSNMKKAESLKIGNKSKYEIVYFNIDKKFKSVSVDITKKKEEFNIPKNAKVIGMVACFKEQKAPLDFVRMCAKIKEKTQDDIYFMIVGDGILRKDIENESKKLNVSDKLILTGWRNDVHEILPIFDVFVLTSLWEGQPISIIQSMTIGVPVSATAVDGTCDVITDGENGFLSVCHDIEELSRKTLMLLNDKNLREKFVNNSKKIIQDRYEKIDMFEHIQNIYNTEIERVENINKNIKK